MPEGSMPIRFLCPPHLLASLDSLSGSKQRAFHIRAAIQAYVDREEEKSILEEAKYEAE